MARVGDPKISKQRRAQANARQALLLLLYTGQRAGDVAAMKWEQYDGKEIEVGQQKTDELL